MKKFLIIASSMLFISSAVFGRDRGFLQTEEFPTTTQLNSMVQVSSVKRKDRKSFDLTKIKKYRTLTSVKNKCRTLFAKAQSGLEKNEWLSEDAKLLYSKLNFNDIWKQIKLVLASNFLNRNLVLDKEYTDITVKTVKDNAKIFYKQVLGNSELGQALYKEAEKIIDSAKCIQCSNLMSIRGSFFMRGDGITCRYCSADDFLLTLIHETGHALDYFYRSIKELPPPARQQSEYGSTFFETLLEASNFRGKLYSQDYSLHGLRIGEIYLDFLSNSLIADIAALYDRNTLLKLYQLFKGEFFSNAINQKENIELDKVVNDLEHNSKTKLFIEVVRILESMGISLEEDDNIEDNQKTESTLRKCLKSLKKVPGYADLKQFLRDARVSKGPFFDAMRVTEGVSGHYCDLLVGDKSVKKIDFPDELKKIDWINVLLSVNRKVQKFNYRFKNAVINAYYAKNSYGLRNFIDLNNHTAGKYKAFRLIKERGYLDVLENGGSLPIEEVMDEFTKPADPLNLTEESAREFLEFLKK